MNSEIGSEPNKKLRVLHFVTGGFSGGATQVAIALVQAAQEDSTLQACLVLRRKNHTPDHRIAELQAAGLTVHMVPGWSNLASIFALVKLCKQWQPDVLVAHGYSEHLWGRYAALLAGVPHCVHVEHNTRERYNWWRLWQSRWLAQRSAKIVGCSEGVRQVLLQQGMPADRTIAIANGIRLQPFQNAQQKAFAERADGVVMVARYSKQKDHATLLHAMALLKQRGHTPPVYFAGGGKAWHRRAVEQLCQRLGLTEQVQFLGVVRDVPQRLIANKIAVLATHYEGMPLALIEGMAAGCAVIGSAVPGVKEIIVDGIDGLLVPESDAAALANALFKLLSDPEFAQKLATAGQQKAHTTFSRERMNADYKAMFMAICGRSSELAQRP